MTTDDHFGDTLMLCIVSPTYFMNIHTVMTDEYACKEVIKYCPLH